MPEAYSGQSGKNLARWLKRQRNLKRSGKLPEEQTRLLDELGMVWETEASWEIGFSHAERYVEANGNLNVPSGYVCEDGYKLGNWVANQRTNHNKPTRYHYLSAEQTRRLELLGIVWNPSDLNWMIGFNHARQYLQLLQENSWQQTYTSPDGYKTGEWIRNQLRAWKRGGMKEDRRARLRSIGLIPEEKHFETPKTKTLPIGGKRNDVQIESRG